MSDKKPKGFTGWTPGQKRTRERVEMVLAILAEYAEELPLTIANAFFSQANCIAIRYSERGREHTCCKFHICPPVASIPLRQLLSQLLSLQRRAVYACVNRNYRKHNSGASEDILRGLNAAAIRPLPFSVVFA